MAPICFSFCMWQLHSTSSALAMELLQSCTKPSISKMLRSSFVWKLRNFHFWIWYTSFNLCRIPLRTFEIPPKISYPYYERYKSLYNDQILTFVRFKSWYEFSKCCIKNKDIFNSLLSNFIVCGIFFYISNHRHKDAHIMFTVFSVFLW